jgi:hypothetical protein
MIKRDRLMYRLTYLNAITLNLLLSNKSKSTAERMAAWRESQSPSAAGASGARVSPSPVAVRKTAITGRGAGAGGK